MRYLKRHDTNSAGGFAWAVDDWTRLRRFLILGSEGGSYYASEWTLTRENAQVVERCLAADGPRTVAAIVRVSDEAERRRTIRRSSRWRWRPAGRRADAQVGARGAAGGLPHGHAPVPVRDIVEGFRGWGRRCGARSVAGTRPGRWRRSPTRR